jgi:hypothetical protein
LSHLLQKQLGKQLIPAEYSYSSLLSFFTIIARI